MTETFDAFAIAAPGLSPLVADELVALGITPTAVEPAGVSFVATREDLARANLWLRIASRVIVRLATFEAVDFATLERKSKTVPWGRVLGNGVNAQLRVTCKKSRLYHSDGVAQRVARGIEAKVAGSRVALKAVDEEKVAAAIDDDSAEFRMATASQLIVVRFDHDVCTISADSSGALLHRRGWRQAVAKAPLRETLAATLVTVSGWDGSQPFVDPFGGSGTIGIEAALRARNFAPGMQRSFAMEQWPGTPRAVMTVLKRDAHRQANVRAGAPIVVADRDAGACRAALSNAERAGVAGDVQVVQRSLSETDLRALGDAGHVVTNPPYGVRVSEGNDLRSLYQRLGDVMRAGGRGWHVTMLAAERSLVAQMKLHAAAKVRTTNGGLPVTIEGT
jgi:putative N6-adenine-specific DNA methylase